MHVYVRVHHTTCYAVNLLNICCAHLKVVCAAKRLPNKLRVTSKISILNQTPLVDQISNVVNNEAARGGILFAARHCLANEGTYGGNCQVSSYHD